MRTFFISAVCLAALVTTQASAQLQRSDLIVPGAETQVLDGLAAMRLPELATLPVDTATGLLTGGLSMNPQPFGNFNSISDINNIGPSGRVDLRTNDAELTFWSNPDGFNMSLDQIASWTAGDSVFHSFAFYAESPFDVYFDNAFGPDDPLDTPDYWNSTYGAPYPPEAADGERWLETFVRWRGSALIELTKNGQGLFDQYTLHTLTINSNDVLLWDDSSILLDVPTAAVNAVEVSLHGNISGTLGEEPVFAPATVSVTLTEMPEPGSIALLGTAGLMLMARRRSRTA